MSGRRLALVAVLGLIACAGPPEDRAAPACLGGEIDAGAPDAAPPPDAPSPSLVLVLDYSASMSAPFPSPDGGVSAVAAMEDAVTWLASQGPPPELGAVAFSDLVFADGVVPVGPGAGAVILERLAAWDTDSRTCTAGALAQAGELLADAPWRQHAVLFSDGLPNECDAVAGAQAAAADLWAAGVTLHTLHVVWYEDEDDSLALVAFMKSISGPPAGPDPAYYHAARTAAEVPLRLAEILAVILESP